MTKRKKKSRKWLLLLLALFFLALIAFAVYKNNSKPKGEEVTTENVSKRTIYETVSASGRIFPEVEVKISSDVSGEIVELRVEEGDSVVTGQILAKIDPEAYVSSVERGRASLDNMKAQVAISNSQMQNNIAQKEQILANLENAKQIHSRNEKLKNDGVISAVEYEQSLSNLRALEANLKAAEAGINASKESIKAAEFQVKSSEASLKELTTNLNRTTIKAPQSGIISSLSVEQGERVVGTIQMTGTEMMRIANLNAMEVQVEVSENDILKVSPRDSVEIEVDAYVDKVFSGIVTEIANSAANTGLANTTSLNTDQVTNFIVKARIDPNSYSTMSRYPFRPGMSASVDIFTNKAEDVLCVPIQSVTVRENDDKEIEEVVFLYEADTARMVKVKTGIQDDDYIEVLEGLDDGIEVVSGPYTAISKTIEEGSELRIKEEEDGKKDKS
jgi:HlyD family secretion protein